MKTDNKLQSCLYCRNKLLSRKKNYCNQICESNHFEIQNVEIPSCWFNKFVKMDLKEKDESIIDLAQKLSINPNFIKRKCEDMING